MTEIKLQRIPTGYYGATASSEILQTSSQKSGIPPNFAQLLASSPSTKMWYATMYRMWSFSVYFVAPALWLSQDFHKTFCSTLFVPFLILLLFILELTTGRFDCGGYLGSEADTEWVSRIFVFHKSVGLSWFTMRMNLTPGEGVKRYWNLLSSYLTTHLIKTCTELKE